jgi:antitoxin FitA
MPTITLKNLPQELHRELKNRARAHHRSLNKEVIATLQGVTTKTFQLDTEAMIRDARNRFKRPLTAKEIETWKKQGRL